MNDIVSYTNFKINKINQLSLLMGHHLIFYDF